MHANRLSALGLVAMGILLFGCRKPNDADPLSAYLGIYECNVGIQTKSVASSGQNTQLLTFPARISHGEEGKLLFQATRANNFLQTDWLIAAEPVEMDLAINPVQVIVWNQTYTRPASTTAGATVLELSGSGELMDNKALSLGLLIKQYERLSSGAVGPISSTGTAGCECEKR